uniref:Rhodanese domain-containing protein n=1 Tax=Skeletonema marinoi TaxID=267567 RepID=A0A7S2P702_9STRA|mmetsp:Transcript_14129/g.23630  ORF Transcript_14129/g.23630 Transcript_14129/m.23630 type:complete len:364 (+) Transcript_14129:74-1165(+)
MMKRLCYIGIATKCSLSSGFTTQTKTTHRLLFQTTRMMMATSNNNLVTIPDAITAHKQNSKHIKFIDGSWHMPVGDNPRNGRAEFTSGPRIPGAFYFDIDDIAPAMGSDDNPKKLPHMKPSSKMFASAMDQMGILPSDTLFVYATNDCAFYHRAYWTLRSCGHDPALVKLVQGSLDEWKECGGELEEGQLGEEDERLFRMSDLGWEEKTPTYQVMSDNEDVVVVDMDQVLDIVNQKDSDAADAVIVDARSAGRFVGTAPEPRPGLRGGHMPGALNVPFTDLLDADDKTKFRPMDEVRDIFIKAGISPDASNRKVVCSCGSGVTAAALAIGLEECGLRNKEDITIFDGSWIEWGSSDSTPIVTD